MLTPALREYIRQERSRIMRERCENDRRVLEQHLHGPKRPKHPTQSHGTGVTQGTLNSTRGRANPHYGITRR